MITLLPVNFCYIGQIKEYFRKPKAGILNINGIEIKVGDEIWARKDERWLKGKVHSIQVDGNNVDKAASGEIGVVLDVELNKGFELYIKMD